MTRGFSVFLAGCLVLAGQGTVASGVPAHAVVAVQVLRRAHERRNPGDLRAALGPLVTLHNGSEEEETRDLVEKAMNRVFRDDDMWRVHIDVARALIALNPPSRRYARLRARMPRRGDALTEVGELILATLGEDGSDGAYKPLRALVRAADEWPLRLAAISALGAYGKTAHRESAMQLLLRTLSSFQSMEPKS